MDYTKMPPDEVLPTEARNKVWALRDRSTGQLLDVLEDGYSPIPTQWITQLYAHGYLTDTNKIVQISETERWEYREYEKTKNELTSIFWDKMYQRHEFIKKARRNPAHPAYKHFAYVSTKDMTQIAFTPSAEYGRRDRQVMMRPGKYLQKFYGNVLTNEDIVSLTDRWTQLYVKSCLKFAVTADEIVDVYLRGPTSCMSHLLDEYEGSFHPVAAYGDSDLQCAYMEDGDRVIARAIVWPAKKQLVRIYGHAARLAHELTKLGYTWADGFCGARLTAVENTRSNGGYCVPYVDGGDQSGTLIKDADGKEWIKITDFGDLDLASTDGCTECTGIRCASCGDEHDADDMLTVHISRHHTTQWCERCTDEYAFYCSNTGDRFRHSDFTCVEINGADVCYECNQENITESSRTGNYYWKNIAIKVYLSDNPNDYELDDPELEHTYGDYNLWMEYRQGRRCILAYDPAPETDEEVQEDSLETEKDDA